MGSFPSWDKLLYWGCFGLLVWQGARGLSSLVANWSLVVGLGRRSSPGALVAGDVSPSLLRLLWLAVALVVAWCWAVAVRDWYRGPRG